MLDKEFALKQLEKIEDLLLRAKPKKERIDELADEIKRLKQEHHELIQKANDLQAELTTHLLK